MKHIIDNTYTVKQKISDGLKAIFAERLISYNQFTTLMAMLDTLDTLDMKKLINIVISEKIGRGIDFLPQKTDDLRKKLCDWTTSYPDEDQPDLKDKIMAALDELRFRKALPERKYNDILKDMGCL